MKETSRKSRRGNTTRSRPNTGLCRLKSSRTRRFERLRQTAPPRRLGARIPSRLRVSSFGSPISIMCRPPVRTPQRCTWRNSRLRRIRSARGKAKTVSFCTTIPATSKQQTLARDREAMTPFRPAPTKYAATSRRAHSHAKPMGLPAVATIGLEGTFHLYRTPMMKPELLIIVVSKEPSQRTFLRFNPLRRSWCFCPCVDQSM